MRTVAGFLDDDPYTGVAKGMDRSSLPKGAEVNATGVRLANNMLESLDGLADFLERVLDDPLELRWLDLSNNRLTTVDPVLLDYPKLSCLYLQGNKIAKLADVEALAAAPALSKITVQDNPCQQKRITASASPPRSPGCARWTSSRSPRKTGARADAYAHMRAERLQREQRVTRQSAESARGAFVAFCRQSFVLKIDLHPLRAAPNPMECMRARGLCNRLARAWVNTRRFTKEFVTSAPLNSGTRRACRGPRRGR